MKELPKIKCNCLPRIDSKPMQGKGRISHPSNERENHVPLAPSIKREPAKIDLPKHVEAENASINSIINEDTIHEHAVLDGNEPPRPEPARGLLCGENEEVKPNLPPKPFLQRAVSHSETEKARGLPAQRSHSESEITPSANPIIHREMVRGEGEKAERPLCEVVFDDSIVVERGEDGVSPLKVVINSQSEMTFNPYKQKLRNGAGKN